MHDYQFMIILDTPDPGGAVPSSYAVGEHFEQFIKEQVQGGRYASASEVVRDGLRLDALRADIRQGLESGTPKPADAVLTRLERKYAAMARERRSK
jgi:antitoxin ParD1/3/4